MFEENKQQGGLSQGGILYFPFPNPSEQPKLRADVAGPREKLPGWTAEAVTAIPTIEENIFCLFFLK